MRRFAIVLIIVLAIGCPILEMADSWDHTAQNGNDVEGSVVVVALCVGIGLASMGASVFRLRPLHFEHALVVVLVAGCVSPSAAARPIPAASPPAILRI